MINTAMFFIHGWAANSRVWHGVCFRPDAHYYDAPQFPDFNHLARSFLDFHNRLPKHQTILVGWSLGGMLALQLAHRFPARVAKIILLSSTCCFITRDNYGAGLAPAIVKRLGKKLRQDCRQTQLDFYKLMFSPAEQKAASTFFATLAPLMLKSSPECLAPGLDYLLSTDLRAILSDITVPCHIIHGSADEICPPAAGRHLAAHLPRAVLHMLPDAGHIPFFTRAADVQMILEECLHND